LNLARAPIDCGPAGGGRVRGPMPGVTAPISPTAAKNNAFCPTLAPKWGRAPSWRGKILFPACGSLIPPPAAGQGGAAAAFPPSLCFHESVGHREPSGNFTKTSSPSAQMGPGLGVFLFFWLARLPRAGNGPSKRPSVVPHFPEESGPPPGWWGRGTAKPGWPGQFDFRPTHRSPYFHQSAFSVGPARGLG